MGVFDFWKKKAREEEPPKPAPVEKPIERHPMERISEDGTPVFEARLDKRSILWEDHTICKSDFASVFASCLGKAFTVERRMLEVVGEVAWSVKLREGLITFGDKRYPVQFIGVESNVSDIWMWGWHNVNQLPLSRLILVNQMQRFGEAWGLRELSEHTHKLGELITGDHMALVTCGLAAMRVGYVPVRQEKKIAYVAVHNLPDEVFAPADWSELIEIVMACISEFPVDHKIFLEGYLYWNQTPFEWDGLNLIAHFENDISFEFEAAGDQLRLSSIKTRRSPEAGH